MPKQIFDTFTGRKELTKTICLGLEPIGNTLENIHSNDILNSDKEKKNSYTKAKSIIDNYYRSYIDKCLATVKLNNTDINSLYNELIKQKKVQSPDVIKKLVNSLKKEVTSSFTKENKPFEKNFIKNLISTLKSKEDIYIISQFKDDSGYFDNYKTNRDNMFDIKPGSIAYRLIEENLRTYIKNIVTFQQLIVTFQQLISHIPTSTLKSDIKALLGNKNISEYFNILKYSDYITQQKIDDYNKILGGFVDANNNKIIGLNELINEYNQKNKTDIKLFKYLHKQILSNIENNFIEVITDNESVIDIIGEIQNNFNNIDINFIDNISNYDLDEIFINPKYYTTLSQHLFDDYSAINTLLNDKYSNLSENSKDKALKQFLSINELQSIIDQFVGDNSFKKNIRIVDFFSNVKYNNTNINITPKITDVDKKTIVKFFTNINELKDVYKILTLPSDTNLNIDNSFYNTFFDIYRILKFTEKKYGMIRSYLSKKPYSTDKVKLNLGNKKLLDGWSDQYGSFILRKNDTYYLAILNKNKNIKNECLNTGEIPMCISDEHYKIMRYNQCKVENTMPKLFRINGKIIETTKKLDELRKAHLPKKIYNIYNKIENSKTDRTIIISNAELNAYIDYYKDIFSERFNKEFVFKDTYDSISDFQNDVSTQTYVLSFDEKVSIEYINELVDSNKLYLFKIYRRDMKENAKGNKKIHTSYFYELFSDENLSNPIFKLNGGAELFFRAKSLEQKITHPKGSTLVNKNPNNPNTKKAKFDIIKDRRYTVDSFKIHIPICINFKKHVDGKINNEVINVLSNNKFNIISIDRGETNLLYATVIRTDGSIIERVPLNSIKRVTNIDGNEYISEFDYNRKLTEVTKNRNEQRKMILDIEPIKNIKNGYLSDAIHEIYQLMIKHNAIIALENLNRGFTQSRSHIEKQIYERFETKLIDKLQYLIIKNRDKNLPGGVRNGYQLCDSEKDITKCAQNGFIFFVQPENTSLIDPRTGFFNMINYKYKNIKASKDIIQNMDSIRYNRTEGYFEIIFNYKNFGIDVDKDWCICSNNIDRYVYDRPNKQYVHIDVNYELAKLFDEYSINYASVIDMKNDILNINDANFFKNYLFFVKQLIKLRYNDGEGNDYIASPIKDKNGEFFCSLTDKDIVNADCNGAYHIGLKCLAMLEKIKNEGISDKIFISRSDWMNYMIKISSLKNRKNATANRNQKIK